MSGSSTVQAILGMIQEREKEYDWLGAIESLKKVLGLVLEPDVRGAGEVYDRLGCAFYHLAMQAESINEFRFNCSEAIKNYEKAKDLYGRLTEPSKTSRKLRCDAMIAYLDYWLASNASEKKRFIDECWRLTKETLEGFERIEEFLEYAKTYAQLSIGADFAFFLEWDYQARKSIIKEAIEHGERTITFLSAYGDPSELAIAYAKTAAYIAMFSYYFLDQDESQRYYKKGEQYWLKANEVCEEKALLESLSSILEPSLSLSLDTDEALTVLEKAYQYSRKTKDKLLLGCASDWLALHTFWKAVATEDPDERVRLAKKALQYAEEAQQAYSPISFTSPRWGKLWVGAPQAEYLYELAIVEVDPQKRYNLLKKASEAASDGERQAEVSGYPGIIATAHHVFSKILASLAKLETVYEEKRKLLEDALVHRNESVRITQELGHFDYWNRGVMRKYLADIKSELAALASDPEIRNSMFEEAVVDMENSIILCVKYMSSFEESVSFAAALGEYQYEYGDLLTRLYGFAGNRQHLRKALEGFESAAESFQRLDLVSRIAECYWKAAQTYDILGEHLGSAQSFDHASKDYTRAAEKIPQLKEFYQDHALYMRAWSEIEKARYHHRRQEYETASVHFEKAANLHKSLKQWSYLTQNYAAWARVEHAEELSRKEQSEEALAAFEQASELFKETKELLQTELEKIKSLDEKQMATNMLKASDLRREYCTARMAVEEAKILDRKGEHYPSSGKYGSAAETFEKMVQTLESDDQKEIKYIAGLSRAWQKMTLADARASPTLYMEASELFEQASEHSGGEATRFLALGHSRFCKALEAGTRFTDTRDTALHEVAIQHLQSATSYYRMAGLENMAEYARAAGLLFDAYVHMDNAKKEINPEKKAKLFRVAEMVLQASAGSYMKAKHPEKSEQVLKIVEKTREEREFASSLAEVLYAPPIISTTAFPAPTPTFEKAVGLQKFEHADIQASIGTLQHELEIGENLDLKIELANAGKGPALLIRIEELFPDCFELEEGPEIYTREDNCLDMKGKRLDPLKTEEIRLVLKSFDEGVFEVKPRIIYIDEIGNQMVFKPEPITVKVEEVNLPNRVATGCKCLDNLILGGIPENYAVVLASPSCDERDLLIRRFLETGARNDEFTFHVTIDARGIRELVEKNRSNLYLFICNPQADDIIGDLPNVVKLKGVENLTDINIALTLAFRKLDASPNTPRRACIEIISDLLLQHHALSVRKWLISLIPELRSRGFTTLAVINPQMHSPQEAQTIIDLFEGQINIYEKETRKGSEKFVKVVKMSNQKYLENELPLRKERLLLAERGRNI